MKDNLGVSIKLSEIPIDDIFAFRANPEFKDKFLIKMIPPKNRYQHIQTRTIDNSLYEVTITILSSVSLSLLSNWIYDKYKKNRIKKPMINGVEVDIENITPEEILAIFAKNKDIDTSEDSTKE